MKCIGTHWAALGCVLAVVSCGSPPQPLPPVSEPPTVAPVTPAASAQSEASDPSEAISTQNKVSATSSVAAGTGIDAVSNDAAVVKATHAVLKCGFNNGFDKRCPAWKTWEKLSEAQNGAADVTFFNFLGDSDIKVQYCGLEGLLINGKDYKTESTPANQLLDYMEKQQDPEVLRLVGRLIGKMDLNRSKTGDRVMKWLEGEGSAPLRQVLASNVLFQNNRIPGMYELFVKLARSDSDAVVRRNAASAFWTGTPRGKSEEVCKLWLALTDATDPELAGQSAYHCALTPIDGGCSNQWDALLTNIEKKAKAGLVTNRMMASALGYLHNHPKVTPAIQARTLSVARTLVHNAGNANLARSAALEFIGKHDDGAKSFAEQFKNDKASVVSDEAARILGE